MSVQMLRDMSLSFVKTVVGNQAYHSLNIHLTQMYSDCVNSKHNATDHDVTTQGNPIFAFTQIICAF